ncbi:MAG: hypothetical protein FWG66_09195 [Spirochaetes bacterium]|nr:hypothetical protein [Spirochaetota bacterium]
MKNIFVLAGILLLSSASGGYTDERRQEAEAYFCFGDEEDGLCFPVPSENAGLGSAQVRMWFVDEGRRRELYPPYRILDLNRFERYYEFANIETSLVRIVFTVETAVRNFRYLRIMWNGNFGDEGERRFSVLDTRYVLDNLTPEIPLVIRGHSFGSALPSMGFSFADIDGVTRYFTLGMSGRDGLVEIWEF